MVLPIDPSKTWIFGPYEFYTSAGAPVRIPNASLQNARPDKIQWYGVAFEWDPTSLRMRATVDGALPSGDVDPTPDTVLIRGGQGEGRLQWIEVYGGALAVANDGQIRLATGLGPVMQAPNDDSSGQAIPISRESPNVWIFGETEKIITTRVKARDAVIFSLASDASEKEHSSLLPELSGTPTGPVLQYSGEIGSVAKTVYVNGGSYEIWENPAAPVRRVQVNEDGIEIPADADFTSGGIPVQKTGPRPDLAITNSANTASVYPTYVDLLSLAYTSTRQQLIIDADIVCTSDTDGSVGYFRLLVDGATRDEIALKTNGVDYPFQAHLSVTAPAVIGGHTIKIQWCTSPGATLDITDPGSYGPQRAKLRVMEADPP